MIWKEFERKCERISDMASSFVSKQKENDSKKVVDFNYNETFKLHEELKRSIEVSSRRMHDLLDVTSESVLEWLEKRVSESEELSEEERELLNDDLAKMNHITKNTDKAFDYAISVMSEVFSERDDQKEESFERDSRE